MVHVVAVEQPDTDTKCFSGFVEVLGEFDPIERTLVECGFEFVRFGSIWESGYLRIDGFPAKEFCSSIKNETGQHRLEVDLVGPAIRILCQMEEEMLGVKLE